MRNVKSWASLTFETHGVQPLLVPVLPDRIKIAPGVELEQIDVILAITPMGWAGIAERPLQGMALGKALEKTTKESVDFTAGHVLKSLGGGKVARIAATGPIPEGEVVKAGRNALQLARKAFEEIRRRVGTNFDMIEKRIDDLMKYGDALVDSMLEQLKVINIDVFRTRLRKLLEAYAKSGQELKIANKAIEAAKK